MSAKLTSRNEAIQFLKLGSRNAIEQWLKVHEDDGFRFINWIRIVQESGGVWCVYNKNVLDIGSINFSDLDEFEEIGDPDAPEGERFQFDDIGEAMDFSETLGAKEDQFVPRGGIQSIYLDFVRKAGVARKGVRDWFTQT